MKKKLICSIATMAAALVTVAAVPSAAATPVKSGTSAATAAEPGDAEIPFVGFGGIQDWRAPNDSTVFLQGSNGQWYRADLMGSCMGLTFAQRIGVQPGAIDTLDKFSSLIVDGHPCPIAALNKISGSPQVTQVK